MADACRDCRHFSGDPAAIEARCRGLASLGSAYASVSGEDGICDRHDRYASARAWCRDFQHRLETAP
jgi:hypothetical protein